MRTTIGERVRAYRLRRGLTQARLAHMIGRSERWLIDVERGGVDPRLSDAVALATVLNVAIDDLAGVSTPVVERAGRPPPRPPVHAYHPGGSPLGRDLALVNVTELRRRWAPQVHSSFLMTPIAN